MTKLRPVDLDFLETAPKRLAFDTVVLAPPTSSSPRAATNRRRGLPEFRRQDSSGLPPPDFGRLYF